MENEPVFFCTEGEKVWGFKGPGWYFWDETWSWAYGPYPSKGKSEQALNEYGKELNKEVK